jgi:hypothetical protein
MPIRDFLAYWWLVMNRSIATWHGLEGLLALVSYVAIFLLSWWALGAFDETYLAKIAVAWLFLLILLITPYRLWREQHEKIASLTDMRDYESILNELSDFFDRGNNTILNGWVIEDDVQHAAWFVLWDMWAKEVEQYLKDNLSSRESNLFRNLVVMRVKPMSHGINDRHKIQLAQVAQQLESLRDTIIRHSERLDKWRAKTD